LVVAGHFAGPQTGMPFVDLMQKVSGSAEYGSQVYADRLGAKAFEIEKFDNKSLLRFFHLVEGCVFDESSL
jgi:hypothetical protein